MTESRQNLVDCIKKVATGEEYSRDISREDAREAMTWILSGNADPIQTAVFLIALRMKRETPEENLGLQDAIRDSMTPVSVDVEDLCTLSDPYYCFSEISFPEAICRFFPQVVNFDSLSQARQTVPNNHCIARQRTIQRENSFHDHP